MSFPIPNGEQYEEINAASPPELPPAVLDLSHGFFTLPYILFVDSLIIKHIGTFDVMKGIAPNSFNNLIYSPSFVGVLFKSLTHPKFNGILAISNDVFIEIGKPSNGGK